MREDTGLLIASPTEGLGYQVAGALQRLGRRMVGLLRDEAEIQRLKHVPMLTQVFDWQRPGVALEAWFGRADSFSALFVSPEPELGGCAPLSEERMERVENLVFTLRRFRPELRVIYALPETLTSPEIDRLRKAAPGATVLLVPAVYGFRDRGLLDGALYALARNPALLERAPEGVAEGTPLVFAGDVASFVGDAAQREDLREKVLAVPPTTRSPADWTRAFRSAFGAASPSLLERLRLIGGGAWSPQQRIFKGAPVASAAPALDFFPTALTPLERSLRETGAHHARSPEIQLVFPPARSI
jgi:hypothetical protein